MVTLPKLNGFYFFFFCSIFAPIYYIHVTSTGDYALPPELQLSPTTYPTLPTIAPNENVCITSQATATVGFQQLSTEGITEYQLFSSEGQLLETLSFDDDLYHMINISQCMEWNTCYRIKIDMVFVTEDTDIDTYWIIIENGQTHQGQFSVENVFGIRTINVCKDIYQQMKIDGCYEC